MAHAINKQSRVVLVSNSSVNSRPLIFLNPSFGPVVPQVVCGNPPVIVPVRFVLNPAVLARMELERSVSLQQGLVPSAEEEIKRMNIIIKLKEIVMKWIERVAYQRRLPQNQIRAASATILTYGSYGLGVHSAESDIDALCVGPWFATIAEDFFIVLQNMLASTPEVSEIHSIKDAKVPLLRFKFEGVMVDMPYAQLKVPSVPEDVDILNPYFLTGIDETSWKSLSGVRANSSILQLVPDVKIFQEFLRCIKLWAKRRGVYGNLFGFFGGVHLAVLAAFICQRHASASLAALLAIFFKTFAFWPWPKPVLLQDGMMQLPVPPETRSLMPIQLPCSPHEYCHSNISGSTFNKIRAELRRGYCKTQDFLKPHFDWRILFDPFPYTKRYPWFMRVCLSASNQDELGDWVGWIKSRFYSLLVKVEEVVQGQCDPNPSEYVDTDIPDPNIVFYWGLLPVRADFLDLDSVAEDFAKNIKSGYQGPVGWMAFSIVNASQLPKNLQQLDNMPHTRAHWRIPNRNQQMIPMYSNHLPHYFVGYLSTNANPEFPSAGS